MYVREFISAVQLRLNCEHIQANESTFSLSDDIDVNVS